MVSAVPVHPATPAPPARIARAVRYDRIAPRPIDLPTGTTLLPPRTRRHVGTLYDYAGLVQACATQPAGNRLDHLDALEDDLDRRHPRHPVVARTRRLAHTHDLPTALLHHLVSATRQDQLITRYARFDDLMGYCRLSGPPLAQLSVAVAGTTDPDHAALAATTATAARLMQLCASVAADADEGRVYLPQDELGEMGLADADLTARPAGRSTRAAVEANAHRAYYLLANAAPRLADLPWPARICLTGVVTDALVLHRALRADRYDSGDGPVVAARRDRVRDFVNGLTRPHRLAAFPD